ncbi:MAG: glucose-1-phosphate adenylyltransferase subunit GlgD [Clostridia bacterium]|nr:glucose-1-phosphate adenylyltransferase subunit GlgD [Clostridia bacterium]
MNNIMGIIFASDNESKLNELTLHRTTASLPFCGRYRFIDFALSNFVNSQITNLGIITRNNYSSLMDHIRMGRDWDLNRKNGGIAVFPPYVSNSARSMNRGKIEALYSILDFIKRGSEDYVVITNSNIAANIDFDHVFDAHIAKGADITMLTYMAQPISSRKAAVVKDNDGRITQIRVVQTPSSVLTEMSLNVYMLRKDLLVDLVVDSYERGYTDLEKHILQPGCDTLKIFAYPTEGYVGVIDDVKSYYAESMRVLDTDLRNDLFTRNGTIFTKVKDSVPTRYRPGAEVNNSLIADGCDIGGKVINSVLFRGVTVEKGAVIENSIVMEGGKICEGAHISYIIADKDVTVTSNKTIGGYETYPMVIVKNKTV